MGHFYYVLFENIENVPYNSVEDMIRKYENHPSIISIRDTGIEIRCSDSLPT